MTTTPEEWKKTTAVRQEKEPKSGRCSTTVEFGELQESKPVISVTARKIGTNDGAVEFVVVTRKNQITVPYNANLENQKARNLAGNKVRAAFETTHKETSAMEATCALILE
ncbi:MAG: hypothetical protein V1792_24910 [Pseudomonadota bacterium]